MGEIGFESMSRRDLRDRLFWMAREDEIKDAKTTDVYFLNTKEVLTRTTSIRRS